MSKILHGGWRTNAIIAAFAIVQALALAPVAGAKDKETAAELCDTFTQREWSDNSDTCNQVCVAAATGEISDCTADADATPDEKNAFWGCCSFGTGLAKGSGCVQNFAKFPAEDELDARNLCKETVNSLKKDDSIISCREGVCAIFRTEACFRGCSLGLGISAKRDTVCEDC